MSTPITAEAVFDHHAVALGLKPRGEDQSLTDYTEQHGKNDEGKRCLTMAAAAASLADHANTHHWLAQARQQIKNPFPPDRRND